MVGFFVALTSFLTHRLCNSGSMYYSFSSAFSVFSFLPAFLICDLPHNVADNVIIFTYSTCFMFSMYMYFMFDISVVSFYTVYTTYISRFKHLFCIRGDNSTIPYVYWIFLSRLFYGDSYMYISFLTAYVLCTSYCICSGISKQYLMAIKIVSLNCNGLLMKGRVDVLITELSFYNPDIIFLQQTHISDFNYAKFLAKYKFKMKAFMSLASTRHTGTYILLSTALS